MTFTTRGHHLSIYEPFYLIELQGGVKLPTGGDLFCHRIIVHDQTTARERLLRQG
jgi:hypothetical protein